MNGQDTQVNSVSVVTPPQVEEKVLITPDIEQMIQRMLRLPLLLLKKTAVSVGGNGDKPKEIKFTERGLYIIVGNKQTGLDEKFIVPLEQLNKLIGVIA